jgi:FixJ family two-component response regulator
MPCPTRDANRVFALDELDPGSPEVGHDVPSEQLVCSEGTDEEPTVFVVDDDAETREVLRALAASAGFAAEVYADAAAFLSNFEPGRCGCLVLDAWMQGMSGLELQKELAARKISIPVIITTGGYADLAVAIDAMKAGAFDVIEKPFVGQRLVTAVRRAIAQHLELRQVQAESQEVRRRYAKLTPRERQVLELVTAGMTSKGIASHLGLRQKTIEVYRSRIKSIMRARNAADLVRLMSGISSPA